METTIKLREADHEQIKQALRRWIVLLKISTPIDENEKILLIEFLVRNYGWMRPSEISTALELALRAEFKADLEHYGTLSAKYISGILNQYLEWKRSQPRKVEPLKELPRFTAEGEREFLIAGMLEKFEKYKTNREVILNSDHVRLLNSMGISLLPYTGKTWLWYQEESRRLEKVELQNKLEANPGMFREIRKQLAEIETKNSHARRLLLAEFFTALIDKGEELRDLVNEKKIAA